MNSNLAGVRFNVLDSFRGLSALFVVFFHMNIAGTMTQTSFLKKSDVFVSFFFILSGFVLSHGYLYKKISFKKFFLSRLIRIYPLHFVFLIAFLCIEILKYVLFNFYGMSFSNVPFEGGNTIEDLLLNSILLHSWVPEI
ncbi:acyltransferase, partial [Vibrio vulnificus]|nr:acyltransferase [Vibrio vulnificus]